MRRLKNHICVGAGIIVLASLAACNRTEPDSEDAHAEEAGHVEGEGEHAEDIVLTAEAAKVAGIETAEASYRPMQGELKVPGTVTNTSQGRAVITPPVDGKITRVHVRVGDNVKAGQAIATLHSADLAQSYASIIEAQRGVLSAEASAKEAKSAIDIAKSKLLAAQQTLSRQKEFAKTGAFSQPALQVAQRELADAEAELERGKQDQIVHEAQLERAEQLYKEELISRTDLEQARLEVATDKIRQRNAERRIDLAKTTFEREQRIAQQNLANSREIQTAEADVRSAGLEVERAKIRSTAALAGVTGAKKGLQAARSAYSALASGSRASGGVVIVVAPIGGVVTHREATIGQAVERTSEICEIENLSAVWVTAQVPEKEIARARKGSRAAVSVSAYPNRLFSGVVQVVGSRLDPKSRTMPVQVLVENSSRALRTEMFASVSLGVGASNSALAVPRSAIVEQGDDQLIYVSEGGGKYEERIVVLGRSQGEYVEILDGIEAGERVVIKGGFILKSEKAKAGLKGHDH